MEEIIKSELPMISGSSLVEIAKQAEERIEAIKKIKKMALQVTGPDDWVDENGKPYLQGSGAEKLAGLFGISWRIDEPTLSEEISGHYTYCFKGYFTMAGRTIECEGSRSSKDPFFKKYEYVGEEKVEKPISDIDRRDVRMAALTNLMGNGITRILGIRNLTWEDVTAVTGIQRDQVRGVKFKKKGEQPTLQEPQKKANGGTERRKISEPQKKRFYAICHGSGKNRDEIENHLMGLIGSGNGADIPVEIYDDVCKWAAGQ